MRDTTTGPMGWGKSILTAAALGLAALTLAAPLAAQSPFSAVITVNERAITAWEIDQRMMLLTFFNTPGDVETLARTGLIEDRLRGQELERIGALVTPEAYAAALDEFAQRANLTGDQLITLLGQNGIDPATMRDFLVTGTAWRDYIRQLYGDRATVSDAEIDAALARQATEANGIEVLLSEIIIPAPPDRAAEARARAEAISQLTSTSAFEAEARAVSAMPSAENGGRLDWAPVTNYPPALQGLLLSLEPGQVTPPIDIENGVALLQLRASREAGFVATAPVTIDYAAFYIPGGRSAAALAEAATVAARVDTCDDLYTVARGLPPERLERLDQAPGQIPQAVALELAQLDPGEVSYELTDASGNTLIFLMMCSRNSPLPEGLTRDQVENQLRGQKLAGFADALLADLRAAATIVGE